MKNCRIFGDLQHIFMFATILLSGWQLASANEIGEKGTYDKGVVAPWSYEGVHYGEHNDDVYFKSYNGNNSMNAKISETDYCVDGSGKGFGYVVERNSKNKTANFMVLYKYEKVMPPYAVLESEWIGRMNAECDHGIRAAYLYLFDENDDPLNRDLVVYPLDIKSHIYDNHNDFNREYAFCEWYEVVDKDKWKSTTYNNTATARIQLDNRDNGEPRTMRKYMFHVASFIAEGPDGHLQSTLRTESCTSRVYYPRFNGNGTAESPLQISSGNDLKAFAAIVNSGIEGTDNLHAVLTTDISYANYTNEAAMIGTAEHPYKGVFDGQGHNITVEFDVNYTDKSGVGLFRYVSGATIQNLSLSGTVIGCDYIGSVVGLVQGDAKLDKVISSVSITSTSSGDMSTGGLAALVKRNASLTVRDCAFSGSILAPNGGNNAAGLLGWMRNGAKTVTFTNCYFAPGQVTAGNSGSCTFSRHGNAVKPTITNCYYTTQLGTVQGTQVTETQMKSGEVCWKLNGSINGGAPWLQTIGTDKTPVLWDALNVYEQNGEFFNFEPSFRGAGTVLDPFQIEDETQLIKFRDIVNAGYNTLCARLVANIDMANYNFEPIGRSTILAYKGTFDGNGYIISNLNINTGVDGNAGLFGQTDGAVIRNIIVKNATVIAITHAGVIVGRAVNSTIENCGTIGIVSLTGSSKNGIACVADDNTKITSCYSVCDKITYNSKGILTRCYCGADVTENHASGKLTYDLNDGSLTPWLQTLGRDEYPLLRGAKNVEKNVGGSYINTTYISSDEAGFIETTSGKDFRVIHHGGRLYEFVFTAATQDGNGIHIMPDADIRYYDGASWNSILELSGVNPDSLAFSTDWWGKVSILSGTLYDTKTYDRQVPTFWARQGNHTDCKQASLLWLAPNNIASLPAKFELKGSAENSKLEIVSNTEETTAPASDASVSFTDPTMNITQKEAGHQLSLIVASNKAYAAALWDATDDRMISMTPYTNGTNNVKLDIPQVESYHSMVALVYAKNIESSNNGNSDTTYVNFAFPFKAKPCHSIIRNNISQSYNSTGQVQWAIAFPEDSDMILEDKFVVARGYKSDYSDKATLSSMELWGCSSTTTENDTIFGWFNYIDTTVVDHSQLVETGDTLSVFDTWNIPEGAKSVLQAYKYPTRYLYYQVYRPVVSSMWTDCEGFSANWKMLQTTVLPTVDSVNVIKDADFDRNHKVKVRVVLKNPYPWELVDEQYRQDVQAEAEKQNFTRRIYTWDKNASITMVRYSNADEYDGITDAIFREITIKGDQIKQDGATGNYYVEYDDVASLPFVHYNYKAKVNTQGSDYPIIESRNKFVACSNPSYTEEFGMISNLKATRGTTNGAVQVTWEADETANTVLELYRYEYQRSYESEMPLESIEMTATNGEATDSEASAAVVNQYILTITTKYRDKVYQQSDTAYGYASYYGSISGRVKMPNGVNMPGGATVTLSRQGDFDIHEVRDPKGNVILPALHLGSFSKTLATDGNGNYNLDSIPYYGTGMQYEASAHCGNASFVGPNGTDAYFMLAYEDASYEYADIDFTCSKTRNFSGRVLFTNSTAPVRDAYIKVNGTVLRDAKGETLVTDAMGNFSFAVPSTEVTVQIVKPGHVLSNDGYILGGENADEKTFTPTKDYAGLLMYDDTRVRLVGRVAGGDIQGSKELGFGLSNNNLGDSITIVFQLEGDKTSYLYFDAKNPDQKSYSQKFTQTVQTGMGKEERIETNASFESKRIVVKADNKTGEFCIDLIPTKYVISQIYANGYGTLYSQGEGLSVIDLGDSVGLKTHYCDTAHTTYTQYDASMRKIYHAPVEVNLLQMRNNKFLPVYGAESMDVEMVTGGKTMQLSWIDSDGNAQYSLGSPVFKGNSYYYFQVQAYEPYYYNNEKTGSYERVPMKGYPVSISNGLSDNNAYTDSLTLNEYGLATFVIRPDNTTFSLTDKDALRHLSACVDINSYSYESETIAGYVTGEKDFGIDVEAAFESTPTIIDYIRDPYGTNAYAYREAGTTYSWAHHLSSTTVGTVNLSLSSGVSILSSIGLMYQQNSTYQVKWTDNYNFVTKNTTTMVDGEMNMTLSNRISTSSDPDDQGAMADIYLGNISTMDVYHFKTITVLDSACYALVSKAAESGVVKLIKEGRNAGNEPVYLVISNGVSLEPGTERIFAYTQKHIINTIIPQLEARRDEAFRVAENAVEASNMSNATNRIVYYPVGNEYSYKVPEGTVAYQDTVKTLNNMIDAWQQLIADNEKLKIDAMTGTPTNAYSVAGVTIQHSESASTYYRVRSQEGSKPVTMSFSAGSGNNNAGGVKTGGIDGKYSEPDVDANNAGVPGEGSGVLGFGLLFNISVGGQESNSGSNTYSDYVKATGSSGYVVTATDNSYFDMDIYHESDSSVLSVDPDFKADIENYESGSAAGSTLDDSSIDTALIMNDGNSTLHSYIYVMRGGATRNPWIDADSTIYYKPDGASLPLGARTIRIDNPNIYIENPVARNTPQDEKAIFTVRLSNETEMSGNYEGSAATMILKVKDNTNPYGAKLYIDGQAIGNGLEYSIRPGEVVNKTLEVERGGKPFDYENIVLTLSDKTHSITDEAKLSVYYLPTSSPVTLTLPTQNFLINTLSQTDDEGKYYIPVQIEGFSTVRYDNFDHIELQYKRQTDGEDQWVNQCSYFTSDSLYARATGTKAMIETEGKISNIRFYGEKDPVEMKYELRAVSFCRLGNGYVTRYSDVISGTKDTRCPDVFGLPKPADGILDFDDVISLPFTEPIAYNYLDETVNFSVQGYTNSSDADNSSSLYFPGTDDQSAVSVVERIMNYHDFTMEVMAKVEGAGTAIPNTAIFMSILDAEGVTANPNLALTFGYDIEKDELVSAVGETVYYSAPLKDKGLSISSAITHVAMTYSAQDSTVHFFVAEAEVPLNDETENLKCVCKVNGPVRLGYNFKGSIGNARLWNKVLTNNELASKYKKELSDREKNLIGYWPMTETSGNVAEDIVGGADLYLTGVSWKTPAGYSLRAEKEAVQLTSKAELAFSRDKTSDYSLMFWFRADDDASVQNSALFSAGSDNMEETGMDKMRIAFKDGNLVLVSEGNTISFGVTAETLPASIWHNIAVTVNRSRNIASLFIDGKMTNEVIAEKLGGMASSYVAFGDSSFTGNIDNISLWNVALPSLYIANNYNASLTGREAELKVNLNFEQDLMNSQGTMYVAFSPYNNVIVSSTGEIAGDVMVDEDAVTPDDRIYAPLRTGAGIQNLPFSWKSTDDELLIDIKSLASDINNQHLSLVVRNVEDLNGNTMENACMWSVYVNRNVLTWKENSANIVLSTGCDTTFVASFENKSGRVISYTLESSAPWLKLANTKGTMQPLDENSVAMTITDGLAPGTYSATVYITDEDNLASQFTVNVVVSPSFTIPEVTTSSEYTSSMNIIAKVSKRNNSGSWSVDMSPRDVVAAFIDKVCVGRANITVDAANNTSMLYMTVLGKTSLTNVPVEFRLYSQTDGQIYDLETGYTNGTEWTSEPLTFVNAKVVGSEKPLEMRTTAYKVQSISLKKGWNWVSFNVLSSASVGLNDLFLDTDAFTTGDIVTRIAHEPSTFQSNGSWDDAFDDVELSKDNVYQIYMQNPGNITVNGTAIDEKERSITLRFGNSSWADMAYLLDVTQPINIALSDFPASSAKAPAGTIIKSHDQFAVAQKDGSWIGSLEYMRPGEGYYVNRNGQSDEVVIKYTNNTASTKGCIDFEATDNSMNPSAYRTSMPVIATFKNGQYQTGDVLLAVSGDKIVGYAEAYRDGQLFFLNVNADDGSKIQFAVLRNGSIVAKTDKSVAYRPSGVVGSLESPYIVDFTPCDDGDVYDIRGIKYNDAGSLIHGVYIINGEKIIK